MGQSTNIKWCDSTFSPWRGCTKVSPACRSCYADTFSKRNPSTLGVWGDNGTRVVASESMWKQPAKWNKAHRERQQELHENHGPSIPSHRVFCASLSDVFEDWQGYIVNHKEEVVYRNRLEDTNGWFAGRQPEVDEHHVTMVDVRERLFNVIDTTPNLDWLLLTKRPENIQRLWPVARTYLPEMLKHGQSRENVWLGCTVENQEYADKRIPELLKCRDLAPVLFLSVEPLLGPIELSDVTGRSDSVKQLGKKAMSGIDWLIVGCESGPNRRQMDLAWARSLRDQCKAAGVAFFVKQLEVDGKVTDDITKFPVDLQIQEFPQQRKEVI